MEGIKEKNSQDNARLWKSEAMDGISLFKACFHNFEYRKHSHDEFAIGVIEKGCQSFSHKGSNHLAPSGSIITVNPDEIHDGRPAGAGGYQYRMVYIEPFVIKAIFEKSCNTDIPFCFSSPKTIDNQLSKDILKSMYCLEIGEDFESVSLFTEAIAELFRRHASPVVCRGKIYKDKTKIKKACEFMTERLDIQLTVEEISDYLGISQYHFIRTFKKTTGLSPHSYLVHQRIKKAKNAMEKGASIVEAAVLAGFSDQSHLTRQFKSYYGITPGQYKKSLKTS